MLLALIISSTTMAFKAIDNLVNKQDEELIWYVKNLDDGMWENHGLNEGPPINCPGVTTNPCAKGFEEDPVEEVTDTTNADDNRFYN